MADLVLPAFEMDCRDWIVLSPAEAGAPEDVAGAPILAVLSSVVIEDDLAEARGALTIGLIDGDEELETKPVAPGASAQELVGEDASPGTRRFVMPSPNGHPLALLGEFVVAEDEQGELERRVHTLMRSFRWQAA